MKRHFAIIILALLTAMIITVTAGCAAKSSVKSQTGSNNLGKESTTQSDTATQNSGAGAPVDSLKKVIKDANLALTARNAINALSAITTYADANGITEFNRNITTSGSNKRVNVVYKLAPENLTAFLDFLATVGTVVSSEVKSSDITEQYYDAQARLGNLQNSRTSLLEVQKKAVTISEIIQVQNEITRVTGEIESLEGKIRLWDNLVAESTVVVSISEDSDPLKPTKTVTWKFSSIKDIGQTMANGFMTTINVLGTVLTWLAIIVVSLSPIIIVVIIVIVISRKRRKARLAAIQAAANNAPKAPEVPKPVTPA